MELRDNPLCQRVPATKLDDAELRAISGNCIVADFCPAHFTPIDVSDYEKQSVYDLVRNVLPRLAGRVFFSSWSTTIKLAVEDPADATLIALTLDNFVVKKDVW